jgi:hypothetical protein
MNGVLRAVLFLTAFLGQSAFSQSSWGIGNLLDWFGSGNGNSASTTHDPELESLRSFPALVAELEIFHANLVALHALALETGVQVPDGGMLWKELLEKKVLRQFRARRALSIVVAGGTKTGKSATFNHLAGRPISQISHIAGATKQAVVGVPPELYDIPLLQLLFAEMQLVENATAAAATENTGTVQKLLVQKIPELPQDLMIIDVPDVDSDNRNNWKVAYDVARVADVVVVMISPEKHGDEAIRSFLKEVAQQAGKPIVVVINKVHPLQIERQHWKDWLNKFCEDTGVSPIAAYVVPFDMVKAEKGEQDFYRISGSLENASSGNGVYELAATPSSLKDDLQTLDVNALKAQAQVGALVQVLEGGENGKGGLSAYLNLLRQRSDVYDRTLSGLSSTFDSQVREWPTPPVPIMNASIERWWDNHHRYDVTKAFSSALNLLSLGWLMGNPAALRADNNLLRYQSLQSEALDRFVADFFQGLTPVLSGSEHYLSAEAKQLLAPQTQGAMLASLKAAYAEKRDPLRDFDRVAYEQLPQWSKNNPALMAVLHAADFAAQVILRPTMALSAAAGGLFAPQAIGAQAVANSAGASLVSAAVAGVTGNRFTNSLIHRGAEVGTQVLFEEIALAYAAIQLNWINEYIRTHHLARVLKELEAGRDLTRGDKFTSVESCHQKLLRWAGQFTKDKRVH